MKVLVNDNIFRVKVCMTPETIQNGMMRQRFNNDFNGMLFMMPENGHHSFWMKNCIIPLDIIFINHDKKINKIHNMCPPCNSNDCDHFEGSGQYVLELEGGDCEKYGIEEGQEVNFVL